MDSEIRRCQQPGQNWNINGKTFCALRPASIHLLALSKNSRKTTAKPDDFTKKDSQTIEFRIPVKPDEERVVTYTVHYSW